MPQLIDLLPFFQALFCDKPILGSNRANLLLKSLELTPKNIYVCISMLCGTTINFHRKR